MVAKFVVIEAFVDPVVLLKDVRTRMTTFEEHREVAVHDYRSC